MFIFYTLIISKILEIAQGRIQDFLKGGSESVVDFEGWG